MFTCFIFAQDEYSMCFIIMGDDDKIRISIHFTVSNNSKTAKTERLPKSNSILMSRF